MLVNGGGGGGGGDGTGVCFAWNRKNASDCSLRFVWAGGDRLNLKTLSMVDGGALLSSRRWRSRTIDACTVTARLEVGDSTSHPAGHDFAADETRARKKIVFPTLLCNATGCLASLPGRRGVQSMGVKHFYSFSAALLSVALQDCTTVKI